MKIPILQIRKEYALMFQEPKQGYVSDGSWWCSDSVSKKEDLLPIMEHRKTQGYDNFKIKTRIVIEFNRRM